MHMRGAALLVTLLGAVAIPVAAEQGALLVDYQRAHQNDPAFAAARAEYEANRIQARLAGTAYYPELKLSASQLENEGGTRQTLTVTQPIINADRWLTLKEAEPRQTIAEANLRKSQTELAQRLFKAVSALVETREKLEINRTSIGALQAQVDSARRAYSLGLGTITDVHDTEVRLAQARSQSFSLQAALGAAEKTYQAIVGEKPLPNSYALAGSAATIQLDSLQDYLDHASRANPSILASEQQSLIGEIGQKRAKAMLLPSVNAVAQQSAYGDTKTSYAGVVLKFDLPVQAGSYYKTQTAAADALKLKEQERDTRQKVSLEVDRLHGLVQASGAELAVRRDAIRAAELSVEANEKSFKGGVRSKLDVLNALQAMFQTKGDYVTAQLQMGDNLLNLLLNSGVDVGLALRQVQQHLFRGR